MKTVFIPIFISILLLSLLQAAPYLPKDETRHEGDWTTTTVVLNQGTRSQIVLGKLIHKKTEVVGEPGHLLVTPLGRFVWHASYDRGYLRGWIPVDSDLDMKELILSEVPTTTVGGLYHTKKKTDKMLPPDGDDGSDGDLRSGGGALGKHHSGESRHLTLKDGNALP